MISLLGLFAIPAVASADKDPAPKTISIRAKATGFMDIEPRNAKKLENGDFIIYANGMRERTIGTGIDEFTAWLFDFRSDPHFKDFCKVEEPLKSASITILIKIVAVSGYCDALWIQNTCDGHAQRPCLRIPGNCGLELNKWHLLSYDLTTFYSSADIMHYLTTDPPIATQPPGVFGTITPWKKGQIPMVMNDDTMIAGAWLTLTKKH